MRRRGGERRSRSRKFFQAIRQYLAEFFESSYLRSVCVHTKATSDGMAAAATMSWWCVTTDVNEYLIIISPMYSQIDRAAEAERLGGWELASESRDAEMAEKKDGQLGRPEKKG